MDFMTYLEEKLDPQVFTAIEDILLEEFPTKDVDDRLKNLKPVKNLNPVPNIIKYNEQRRLQVR
jgi:hypothetical protein